MAVKGLGQKTTHLLDNYFKDICWIEKTINKTVRFCLGSPSKKHDYKQEIKCKKNNNWRLEAQKRILRKNKNKKTVVVIAIL